jgi:GMP synthase-like glutamine amidotransferase
LKRALVVQNSPIETLGSNFGAVLREAGFSFRGLGIHGDALQNPQPPFPAVSDIEMLVALGGPASANDPYPALRAEERFLGEAHGAGVPILAVCLGAQLLSKALGGVVEATGGYQFGLRKIHVRDEGSQDPVFGNFEVPLVPTCHGDCFTVPPGGTRLAEGDILLRDGGYRRIAMAYRHGTSYGFQFEPQLTPQELEGWNREMLDDYRLMGERFDAEEEASRHLREFRAYWPVYQQQTQAMLRAFLGEGGIG